MKYPSSYEEAVAFEQEAALLVEKNIANSALPRSEETLSVLREIQALVPVGEYYHFKGGTYTVLGIVERVNSGMCDVRYYAHYGAYKGIEATRELVGSDSFLRPVDRAEYRGVRFMTHEDMSAM